MNSPHGASPEGGSTGLERTQDQLEIALREGDESSSVAQIAPASKSADLDAGPSALAGLLARVEAAEAPDRALGHDLVAGLDLAPADMEYAGREYDEFPGYWAGGGMQWEEPDLTASLDAALALCERVLPEADPKLWKFRFSGWGARLSAFNYSEYTLASHTYSKTPAFALLAAMLKALVAEAAGPAIGSSHRLDEPLLSKGGGESPR